MDDPSEYADGLHPKAASILRALSHKNGKASTPQISHQTDIDNNNLNYWFRKLRGDGVIEHTGETVSTKGFDAYVYRLTEFGEGVVADVRPGETTLDRRVQNLEAKTDSVEVLRESHRELEEEVDELRDVVKRLIENQ